MGRWLRIEVGNATHAWAATAVLMALMAGHTVLETARDSLFLSRAPVTQLPFTYAAIAVAALFAAELGGRLHARFDRRAVLAAILLVGATVSVAFVVPFRARAGWAPHAFYVWIALIATLAVAQFWLLLSELFTVAEAKRLYALVSAGGLLGAVFGGLLARFAAQRFGDAALLFAGSGLFVIAALVPGLPRAAAPQTTTREPFVPPSRAGRGAALRDLRSERYLRRLLGLTLLATVAVTMVDYLFKAEVVRAVPASELGGFFGGFNAVLNGAALIAQLALAPRLLDRLGVGRALLVPPAAVALSALGALVAPSLLTLAWLRGLDGTLRHSLHRSSVEVLYLPLPTQARARWKMVVDALGQRGGQALASLLILACIALSLPPRAMVGIALGVMLGWLALSLTMERRYIALFRAKVKAGAIETRPEVPALDLRSLESLVAALGSESDEEVLATLDLLVEYERTHAIPALILYHPSRAVVVRALDIFASSQRTDFAGTARRLLERDDDEIRAAAMLALSGQMQLDELTSELDKPLPTAARAAVLVAIGAREHDGGCTHQIEIERGCAPDADERTRLAFARAFRLQGDRCCVHWLSRLAEGATPELEVEVSRAMLAVPHEAHVPALLRMLGGRGARSIARDALHAIGAPALDALRAALDRADLPRTTRAHLPRSISRFRSAAATDSLLDRLDLERDGWVRFKIIRGLGQLREHLRTAGRTRRVIEHARATLRRATQMMAYRLATERERGQDPRLRTRGGELLVAVLHEKEQLAIDRAVRLVGLLHAANVIHNIRQALAGRDPRLRADSIELLVHPAPSDIAQALTHLLGRGDDRVRLARAALALSEPATDATYKESLRAMLADDSEAVRCVAAYHVGELGLTELGASVADAAEGSAGRLSSEVFERVGALLERIDLPELADERSAGRSSP
jgi:ATP:ADP antiporter, AAA family